MLQDLAKSITSNLTTRLSQQTSDAASVQSNFLSKNRYTGTD